MSIKRITDPGIIEFLEPHFTFYDEDYKTLFINQLRFMMTNASDSVFVIVSAVEEKPRQPDVKGFVIAQNFGPEVPHVYVAQAFNRGFKNHADQMFLETILWAVSLGKKCLKADTIRETGLFRRFGFIPAERVVRFNITQELKDRLLSHAKEIIWEASNPTLTHTAP